MAVNTPYAPIRRGEATDQRVIVDVLTEAFMDDPVVGWLFPGEDDRARLQPHFYRSLLTHPAAETYLAGDAGAAVWLTLAAGEGPYADAPGTGLGERLLVLGQALAARHPGRAPHVYLPCMGVATARQGTGLGSALLRHRLQRADADGHAAYLEASSPRSRALYLRHGFADLGDPVRAAGSPPLWPMWRDPKPTTKGRK